MAIWLSVIGDVDSLSDKSKLLAYFDMMPRVSSSKENERSRRITKCGTKLGCTILVQCTFIAMRHSDDLRNFYDRLKVRKRSRKTSRKAIVATAKKLLSVIYKTLKNDWGLEDFSQFILVK